MLIQPLDTNQSKRKLLYVPSNLTTRSFKLPPINAQSRILNVCNNKGYLQTQL